MLPRIPVTLFIIWLFVIVLDGYEGLGYMTDEAQPLNNGQPIKP